MQIIKSNKELKLNESFHIENQDTDRKDNCKIMITRLDNVFN